MKPIAKPTAPKRPYRTPRLVVHGNLTTMTKAKKGTTNDGSGKPKTRLSGGQT